MGMPCRGPRTRPARRSASRAAASSSAFGLSAMIAFSFGPSWSYILMRARYIVTRSRDVTVRACMAACSSGVALALAVVGSTLVAQTPVSISTADVAGGLKNPSRWLSYSGDYTSQRYSPLTQITAANATQLGAQWTFQTGVTGKFEATPIV